MAGRLVDNDKRITVGALKRLLDELDDGDLLYPNQLLNLAVFREEEYVGYVDIAFEEVELFDGRTELYDEG